MTYENYIKGQLVRFCVDEAWHERNPDSVLAIAQTLKNRVDEGWCGGDWLSVIHTAPDFVGTVRENRPSVEPRDLNFRRILQSIDDIYYGLANSPVNDDQGQKALYYAELHNINRDWFTETIARDPENHPMIAKVGQLNFFA